ncbi:TetR/AcrR family transcriptional regulator [Actinoplanes sp. TBRC 11911]|uniref:TetR/AcrR family transcriptional regulator n=1 Tax=Actinoplanes sp. TBRC 11911 TaxID=2729386 RepID=UPI00145EEB21|nr:TetR/AcrR family transcriptional regulator [Actinoplanes sp. TBRC 11911]NMO57762.1 TetR/AcrR family transcriptional regulator [Actinoplanes sp. TBRC 11911]
MEISYQRGNLRVAVLSHAAARLEEVGFDRLSLREIARTLGVSHAAPGKHFPTRAALQEALVVYGLDELADHLDGERSGDFAYELRAFVSDYVRWAADHPALAGMILARTSGPQKGTAEIREANQRAYGGVQAMLRKAREEGVILSADQDRVDMAILAVIQGLTAMASQGALGGRPLDDVIDGTVQTLLYGLVPRAAAGLQGG